jgi:hypothetical protein
MVRARIDLSGSHFGGSVLGVVENLQVIDLGPVAGAAVTVPVLFGCRTFDQMIRDADGEGEVAAEQRSYSAGDGRIQEDVLDKPVFLPEGILTVLGDEVEGTFVDLLGHDGFEKQIALSAELENL